MVLTAERVTTRGLSERKHEARSDGLGISCPSWDGGNLGGCVCDGLASDWHCDVSSVTGRCPDSQYEASRDGSLRKWNAGRNLCRAHREARNGQITGWGRENAIGSVCSRPIKSVGCLRPLRPGWISDRGPTPTWFRRRSDWHPWTKPTSAVARRVREHLRHDGWLHRNRHRCGDADGFKLDRCASSKGDCD